MRIQELERQRDTLRAAVEHVNKIPKPEYAIAVRRLEEASHAQHVRDQEVADTINWDNFETKLLTVSCSWNNKHKAKEACE